MYLDQIYSFLRKTNISDGEKDVLKLFTDELVINKQKLQNANKTEEQSSILGKIESEGLLEELKEIVNRNIDPDVINQGEDEAEVH